MQGVALALVLIGVLVNRRIHLAGGPPLNRCYVTLAS